MPNQSRQNQELHEFPLPEELEGVDFVDLARQAQDRFCGQAAITPLEKSEVLSCGDNEVWIKRADQLPGGNFKFFTAGNTVASLREEGYEEFVTATYGSYGIGLGYAISAHGGRAKAFLPNGSNLEKQEIMQDLGLAAIELKGSNNFDEADRYARAYAEEHGLTYLPPFASVKNIAGAGVLGLELADQSPDMTHEVAQYGGGSLHGGVGSVLEQLRPDVHKVVVQVAGCSPFVDSVRQGKVKEASDHSSHIMPSYFRTLGGVGVGRTYPMTLGLGSRIADSVDTVSSSDVYATMHDVYESHGVLPEFAAAVSLEGARKLARTSGIEGATIVAVLTGNHPDEYLPGWLARKSRHRQNQELYGVAEG